MDLAYAAGCITGKLFRFPTRLVGFVVAVVRGAVKRLNLSPAEAKRIVIEQLAAGQTVANACMVAERSEGAYRKWRSEDPDFRAQVDRMRVSLAQRFAEDRESEFPRFADFSEQFLGAKVFPHVQNIIDLIEGRDPSWLHPAMSFERNEPDLLIANLAPEHSKSVSITMNYVTYRIAENPNIRVLIVSKTEGMAKKFLMGIKERLSSPRYSEFHVRYGPPGGYASNSESWSQKMIYVSADARDSGEKDPTVEALGIRGHIYGARADLIILDDCVDSSNAHEYEKQIEWIQSMVLNRVSSSGAVLVIGTRLTQRDLYVELRDPRLYPDERNPWSYLSMPAVLEFADDPKDWVTLWPRSNIMEIGARGEMAVQGEDGLYPKWDGPRLSKRRARMRADVWARVYMQQQVDEDAIFHPDAIKAAINGNRMTGLMPKGMVNCRPNGMDGLVVVAGMDPAMVGFTAATVIGLDPGTQMRYVLDIHNEAKMSPDGIRDLIKSWTNKYGIQEWRIEKNAFQSMLTQDREVLEFLTGAGCVLQPHWTGNNKTDPDFGVASLGMLFGGWRDKRQMIELPSTAIKESMKALVEQFVTWHPNAPKSQKTDIVMSLWFAELACRDRIRSFANTSKTHLNNIFATPHDLSRRFTVNFSQLEASQWGAAS